MAAAERSLAEVRAQIGVATETFFPTVSLSTSGGLPSKDTSSWFITPARVWTLGASLAGVLFDGGFKKLNLQLQKNHTKKRQLFTVMQEKLALLDAQRRFIFFKVVN